MTDSYHHIIHKLQKKKITLDNQTLNAHIDIHTYRHTRKHTHKHRVNVTLTIIAKEKYRYLAQSSNNTY